MFHMHVLDAMADDPERIRLRFFTASTFFYIATKVILSYLTVVIFIFCLATNCRSSLLQLDSFLLGIVSVLISHELSSLEYTEHSAHLACFA